jgi:hypothetical protein
MLKYMNELLLPFRACFSRQATFEWFVVIVIGFMLRSDHLGMTSVIRDLSLNPRCYETLIHFFRSSAWSLQSLRQIWLQVIRRSAPLLVIQDRVVLVGDGMKQAKEARRMPGSRNSIRSLRTSPRATISSAICSERLAFWSAIPGNISACPCS